MQKKFYIIMTTVLMLVSLTVAGQQDDEQSEVKARKRNLLVSISPQHLIKSGLRVEIEPHLGSKQWLTIAPAIYLNHSYNNQYNSDFDELEYNNTYDKLTGAGLELNHKIFLYDKGLPSGPYFAYGLYYQHVFLEYEEYVYYPDVYDGLNVQRYGVMDIKHNIDKVGTGILLGYHYPVEDFIFVDLYMGVGIRYSFQNVNYDSNREYSGSIIDFGYTGTLPLAGFKCGFVF